MSKRSPTFEAYKITNLVNGKVYIGITARGTPSRWAEHLYEAKAKARSALHRAINKYGSDAFLVTVVGTADSWSDLCALECLLITEHKCLSPRGYNMTSGGDGLFAPSDDVRACMTARNHRRWDNPETRAATIAAMSASQLTPAVRIANAERNRLRTSTPEYLATFADRMRRYWESPEARAKAGAQGRLRMATAEARAAHAVALKAGWTPEVRAAHAERERQKSSAPEVKAAMSKRMRAYFAVPENLEAMSEQAKVRWSLAENRAAQSERTRKHMASSEVRAALAEKTRASLATPEARAARGAAIKAGHARNKAARLALKATPA